MDRDKDVFVTAFSGTLWEAEMVKTLLLDAGVESFLQHATLNSYAFEPISSEGVKVIISGRDIETAKAIVEVYSKNNRI